jgi:hypothetical protein
MKNTLKIFIWLVVIFISTQFTYAELPWYTCKVHWKIIWYDEYFRKRDCFKLTKLKVQRDNWRITEFTAITRYHDTCFKAYFDWWYKIQNVLSLQQFIPDHKNFWKTYFFKIEGETFWKVNVYPWWLDKETASKIPIDNIWEIPVDSIMSWYYTEEPSDFKSLPECYWYNIENINTTRLIKKESTNKIYIYKYIGFWVVIWLILSLLPLLIYKKIKKQKK